MTSTARAPSKKQKNQAGREGVREYFDNALLENQPRLTDLIPKSLWAYLALLLLGGISIYGCQQAFLHTRALQDSHFPSHLFEIAGPGNLASWCLSVMLLLLSVGAVMVYLLRRHKADDYKGRYRLWLHLAAFAGILSVDAATGLHELLMIPLSQTELSTPWDQAVTWWIALVTLGASYMAMRLLLEFKGRPGMLTLMFASTVVLIAAGCSRLGNVIGESQLTTEVAQSSLTMSATLLICLMTWLNARKIYRNAQRGVTTSGKKGVKSKRVKRVAEAEELDAEQQKAESVEDPQWDDWDEFEDEEMAEPVESYDEFEQQEDDEIEYEEEAEYYEEEEEEELEAEQDSAEHEEYVEQQAQVYEQADQEQEEIEEVIYSTYASSHENQAEQEQSAYASDQGRDATVYETQDELTHQTTPMIPPPQSQSHEPFDEDAFWEQYDLTKMSRKQLKTMRKKLNRLKRKHAEKQRAA